MLDFRARHPGTAHATVAAGLLHKLPAPTDRRGGGRGRHRGRVLAAALDGGRVVLVPLGK